VSQARLKAPLKILQRSGVLRCPAWRRRCGGARRTVKANEPKLQEGRRSHRSDRVALFDVAHGIGGELDLETALVRRDLDLAILVNIRD
jgi:hypothetical protein